MVYSDRELVWGGIAVAAWVLYQCATGRFAYMGRGFRREDAPGAFWAAIAFEALFALAGIGSGLGRTALALAVGVLLFVSACGFIGWGIRESRRIERRYPRVFPLLRAGRPGEAARELEAHLAAHPDDRAAMWWLAGAYRKAGDRSAATQVYALLAQTGDPYGREAKRFLPRQASGTGSVLDMPIVDVIRWCVRGIGGRRQS